MTIVREGVAKLPKRRGPVIGMLGLQKPAQPVRANG
jgi:hypothetical protein